MVAPYLPQNEGFQFNIERSVIDKERNGWKKVSVENY